MPMSDEQIRRDAERYRLLQAAALLYHLAPHLSLPAEEQVRMREQARRDAAEIVGADLVDQRLEELRP